MNKQHEQLHLPSVNHAPQPLPCVAHAVNTGRRQMDTACSWSPYVLHEEENGDKQPTITAPARCWINDWWSERRHWSGLPVCKAWSGEDTQERDHQTDDQEHALGVLSRAVQNKRRCDNTFCKVTLIASHQSVEAIENESKARMSQSQVRALKLCMEELIPASGAKKEQTWDLVANETLSSGVSRAISVKPSVEPRETVKNKRYTTEVARFGDMGWARTHGDRDKTDRLGPHGPVKTCLDRSKKVSNEHFCG